MSTGTSTPVLAVNSAAVDDGEDEGSVYEPPPTVGRPDDDEQSFGDTISPGSIGELVGDEAEGTVGGGDSSDEAVDEHFDEA